MSGIEQSILGIVIASYASLTASVYWWTKSPAEQVSVAYRIAVGIFVFYSLAGILLWRTPNGALHDHLGVGWFLGLPLVSILSLIGGLHQSGKVGFSLVAAGAFSILAWGMIAKHMA